ncbi:MAG: hypothetical protein IKX47_08755 [Oscillospiraceae bacterium]|nr:hypothetical protein [Oscillospiraceae bacterium]
MSTSIRYTLRHMFRGGGKTVLAILLALLLTAAVGRLDSLRQHYEALSRSVLIQGSVLGGLTVYRAEKLAAAEEVKDYYLEESWQDCLYLTEKADRPDEASFVLYYTSDYTKTTDANVEWLDGWDGESFQKTTKKVCLMPRELAEHSELVLGDRIHIAEAGYGSKTYMNHPEMTADEIIALWKRNVSPTTVVGLVSETNVSSRLWLPIHGMDQYSTMFPGLKVETAIYTLRDYRDVQPFREYFMEETSREKGNPSLYLDTAEADRIRKMANLLSTLYPIALGVALLLGGILPSLMVLQNSRETAILRVLGMSRRRVCAMLTGEQVLLCILGLILGVAAAFFLGAGWELTYPGLHLAACLIGSIVFAWISTGKDLLSLLQAKE